MSPATTSENESAHTRGGRSGGAGGARLADAFETITRLPALAEARRRLMDLTNADGSSASDVAEAVESDAALAIAVLRAANNGVGPPARVGGVQEAVDALTPSGVRVIASSLQTYDPLEGEGSSPAAYERFRRHALATRHAADCVAEAARLGQRDELAIAALLHDVGRLVLGQLYGDGYGGDPAMEGPEERARGERRELGIDHALVGAVLVRRWGLKPGIAASIEGHHSPEAEGHAAAVGLADAIVHHASGDRVPVDSMIGMATRLDLSEETLRALVYEFPHAGTCRRRASEPCPLSAREVDALRGLAEGKVYKQIAQELSLSVSTIRTHLHNVYRKIGAVDRAQAVLMARDRGWI
ncbi:MAG: HDOD domain-containing protein [Solirubrobacterales bacterium]